MAATGLKPTITSFVKEHSTIQPNSPSDWAVLWLLICTMHLTVGSYHDTHSFQSKSTLYSYLKLKELNALNIHEIWSLNVCNGTRTHNHLVPKRTLNYLVKLGKWLSCVVSTYLYCAFDCTSLSCQGRRSE